MKEMLKKGDVLKPRYEDFDYSKLDETQLAWLSRLSLFSRYRNRIEKYFEEAPMTSEMKLLFVEQHSMKLGDRVFYDIESKR